MICVCCILLCGFYLRGPCTIGPQVGKVAEKDDALTTWTSQIEAGHDHGAATEALAWWFIYVYIYIYIYVYIRGIILIISPQGSGSWIIIIYLECYGVVPPIWFPCRVFFSPIVWCPFWISFAAQKKYHFEVHSSDQTWQWKIMVLKSISVNEACSFAMFDYMWVLSCMRSHGV